VTTTAGIDVSHWQRKVDWRREWNDGARFAHVRVADGTKHLDGAFGQHTQGAHEAGLLVGAYLFWRAEADPIEQAHLLLSQQAHYADLPAALDAEATSEGALSQAKVRERFEACLAEVTRHAGRCMVYTCFSWWDAWMGPGDRQEELWVAHYGVESPRLPRGWQRQGYRIWQATGTGQCAGIQGPCDRNVFAGDAAALQAWARGVC
jgi:GH25 family lysozyme M1 (1,4-beta-N-acetylmuramidase)